MIKSIDILNALKDAIIAGGTTQQEIADKTGVSRYTSVISSTKKEK